MAYGVLALQSPILSTVLSVSVAAFAVTLLSGLGALYLRNHKAMVFAFCSGALIGSAIILLLPDARQLLEQSTSTLSADLVWLACALGFLCFYLFERGSHAAQSARIAGLGGVIGLATHSLFDGVVIGQGFRAGEEIGVALASAVLLHKLADGVSAVGVMLGTEHSVRETTTMLVITAVAPVLGAVAQSVLVLPKSILALLLAWFAGMFLYLGASRLLPEARRESDSLAVPVLSVTGIAVAYIAHVLSH
jgi:ZIP family zinc transporter